MLEDLYRIFPERDFFVKDLVNKQAFAGTYMVNDKGMLIKTSSTIGSVSCATQSTVSLYLPAPARLTVLLSGVWSRSILRRRTMASTNKKPFGGNKGRRSAAAIAPRRNKVAALVAEGKTVVAIAKDLGTPLRTVTNDLTHLRGSL